MIVNVETLNWSNYIESVSVGFSSKKRGGGASILYTPKDSGAIREGQ